MVAVRAVDMAVIMWVVMGVIVIMVAIRAVDVGLLVHRVTPELNRRELCRRCAQDARYVRIKVRS